MNTIQLTKTARTGLGALALALALCATTLFASSAFAATPGSTQLATGTVAAQASAKYLAKGATFKVDGTTYRVTDRYESPRDLGDVTLVSYGSTNRNPVVDTVTYNGQTFEVDAIGKNAFNNARGHAITSIKLSRNVDKIKAKAFAGCTKLKTIDLSLCDVVDIEYAKRSGYYLDEIDVGSGAFKNAGVKNVKVKCGTADSSYRKVFKKALVKKGLRSTASVVQ